ncbi:MAG: DUF4410 domain-containing protein [Methylacidiphilales bacterium]|nr:DUF4410 domain-containing protein [Candidatus Methylacidiphilales bacterium]
MPEIIYVSDFSTAHSDFNVDRKGAELAEFKKNLQLMLKTAMVTDLTDKLVPAADATKSARRHDKIAWLIQGQFTTVNQGSRLLRSAIGFGAGGTKMETRVHVYDLSGNLTKPIMTFSTTGGSGAEPGAVLAMSTDPLQLAIGGVSGVAHGLSEDTKRTARMITAQLSDYMFRHGWINADQRIEPKKKSGNDVW